uniref:SpoIIE family protein phosphatase n=1 Tax=uncultured Allobacillus sp. TaxID=1638025 RepID=UPI0025959C2D|nr:SpoIIE family protein phosphatase [uncultured Allobacillus sp.]
MIQQAGRVEIATYEKPKKGNYHSGDSYFYIETKDHFLVALSDGLGSGEVAKKSSQTVIDVIRENIHQPLDDLLGQCNAALFGNELRGCVLGILRLDFNKKEYSYVSVGNISIVMISAEGKKQRNIPIHGYLSGIPRKTKVHYGELQKNTLFFMFSDGVSERQLTKEFYSFQSMQLTVDWFTEQQKEYMEDDTTLIAMKFLG